MLTATEANTLTSVQDIFQRQLAQGNAASKIGKYVTIKKKGSKYRFELSKAGEELNKKYQQAYQIAEEKGPRDKEVLQLLEELTTAWPSHPGVVENSINEAMDSNDSQKALDVATEAIRDWHGFLQSEEVADPTNIQASGVANSLYNQVLANYEFILERNGKLPEALEIATLARTVEPSDPENLMSAVISLSIRTGDYEGALRELSQLQDSLAPFVLYGRALAYYALGQPENAQAAAQIAIRQWPQVAQGLTKEWTGATPLPKPGEAVSEAQVLYGYFEVFGPAWQSVEGAIDWLRSEEKTYQRTGGKMPQHVGLTRSGMTTDGNGNLIPQQAPNELEQLLQNAKVVGEDEFTSFVEISDNVYSYNLKQRGAELQEIHKDIFRRDLKQKERTEALKEILAEWPGNADAAVSIARILGSEKHFDEALDHLQNAIFDLQKFWPEDIVGTGKIETDWPQNRPLLLAYAYMVSFCAEEGETDAAKEFAADYLAINPKDNYGVRQKAIEIALEEGDNDSAIRLINDAHDPISAYNLFGKALALFRKGDKAEADQALLAAIESRPLVYRELTADKHRMPPNYNPSYVAYFSIEEAYNYHVIWGPLWRKTMGALAWLRKVGKENRDKLKKA